MQIRLKCSKVLDMISYGIF